MTITITLWVLLLNRECVDKGVSRYWTCSLARVMYQEQDKKRHASKRFNRIRKSIALRRGRLMKLGVLNRRLPRPCKKVDSRKKKHVICGVTKLLLKYGIFCLRRLNFCVKNACKAKSRRMKDDLEFLIRTHNEECDLYIPLYDERNSSFRKEIKIAKKGLLSNKWCAR